MLEVKRRGYIELVRLSLVEDLAQVIFPKILEQLCQIKWLFETDLLFGFLVLDFVEKVFLFLIFFSQNASTLPSLP